MLSWVCYGYYYLQEVNTVFKARRAISVLLICFLTVALPMSASAGDLFVTPVRQAMSNWCWAACDVMAGDYEVQGSARSQSDVVQYIHGSIVNKGATISQIAEGAEYVTYHYASYYGAVTTFSLDTFKYFINDLGNPVIAVIVWFDTDDTVIGAHALLVCGHNTSGN